MGEVMRIVLPPFFLLPLFLASCATPHPGSGGPPQTAGAAPAAGGSLPAPAAEAAGVPPYAPLIHSLGERSTEDGRSECSLSASAPAQSPLKRQQLQFAVRRSGPGGWFLVRLLVQTGASKSQAELQSLLTTAIRKAGNAARGDELAKIGDIRFGGELRLQADGNGGTTFTYNPGLPEGNPTLSAEECAVFADLLSR